MITKLKRTIAKTITQPVIGNLIKIINPKISYFDTVFIDSNQPYIGDETVAMIFWKIYERGEARLIRKFLTDQYPVIEFGASLGVISSLISTKIGSNLLLSIEPNEDYIDVIKKNLKDNNAENFKVINGALSYSDSPVYFIKNKSNLAGKISLDQTPNSRLIEKVTISKLLLDYNLNDFVLVSDIEGTEIEFLLYDKKALEKCQLLIIETHRVTHKNIEYDHQKMKDLILSYGFNLLQSDGVCMVFNREKIRLVLA